jgi:hypothetical protein
MDLMYIRDSNGIMDSGYLKHFEADFDITTDLDYVTNDFEIKMSLPSSDEELFFSENKIKTIVYVEGTEYGGEITGSIIDTDEKTITYTGRTWRGTLSQWIIEPPAGQDYRVVSGNLATILRQLPLSSYLDVADTTYTTGTFQFDRYITSFEGITKLLTNADASLRIGIEFHEGDEYTGIATITIQPTRDATGMIEVSQDYNDNIKLRIQRDHNTPKHLICLGQGELKNREVIHLYADENWNIVQTAIPGAYPTEIYDFSSTTALLSDGMKRYKELIDGHELIDVAIKDLDIRLGDIISARDRLTNENVAAEITNIIWRCTDYGDHKTEEYEYKTKVRR